MIGLVIVSHSARLAEGVCELAAQVAQDKVRMAAAGGTSDPQNPIGTDAFKVLRAIESVYSEDGVFVLTDLGSAVLSAETALEMLDAGKQPHVRLCPGSLVESAVAIASQAGAGAAVAEIAGGRQEEQFVTVANRLGLHARPAAQLIRLARRFQARVTIENLSRPAGPFDAGGIHGVLSLGARQGHRLRVRAVGPQAAESVAELAAFIERREPEIAEAAPTPAPPSQPADGELAGIPGSAGIAIGPLVRPRPAALPETARVAAGPEAERRRLLDAIHAARAETRQLYEWAAAHAAGASGIFDAQLLFLEDPELIAAASHMIAGGRAAAEFAWRESSRKFAERINQLEDPYLRARAADVEDVAARVLRRLIGLAPLHSTAGQPCVVAARDLTPSEAGGLDPALVLGVCLEMGSANQHSVILVRAMGIPAVVGLGPGISALPDGTVVALDGERGTIWVSPAPDRARELELRRRQWLADRSAAQAERQAPAATRDGHRIQVFANLSHTAEVVDALNCGAEGVGVLRTEFLFLGRAAAPGEEEQLAAYSTIAEALAPRPLVVRTLDIGGDKSLPYVDIGEEANPFLGWRGIRVTLSRRDLLRTQLRAILRAACGHSVEVLFPMVSSLAELREAKAILAAVQDELRAIPAGVPAEPPPAKAIPAGVPAEPPPAKAIPAGVPAEPPSAKTLPPGVPPEPPQGKTIPPGVPPDPGRQKVKVGIMIEVPSAVAVADQLAPEVDFFSIGSNDLTQYTMAADRTNARVAFLADAFQPAVLRLIRQAIDAGRHAGIGVTLCGELAADRLATPLLLGLGLREFSVSAPLIPQLKRAILRWSLPEAEAVAREAMSLDSADAVRAFLASRVGGVA